jgi:hypothetical protein
MSFLGSKVERRGDKLSVHDLHGLIIVGQTILPDPQIRSIT